MKREVAASLSIDVATPTRLGIQVAVADPAEYDAHEDTRISLNGAELAWSELTATHGGRIWLIDSPPGRLEIYYRARLSHPRTASRVEAGDDLIYLRPSRFCESDRLAGFAAREFHHLREPREILPAVSSWVGTHLEYISGSSGPTDGAVDTLLAGSGVCRDYAHLTVALLRALEIPARVVAVYAPGLDPMDFHAVAEAIIDDAWCVVDASLLAPRQSLVSIATGRDAADTSFLSGYHGNATLVAVTVAATVSADLPIEDVNALVQLS